MDKKTIVHISYDFFSYADSISRQLKDDGYDVIELKHKKPNIGIIKKYYYRKKNIQYVKLSQENFVQKNLIPFLANNSNKIDVILVSLIYMDSDTLKRIRELCPNAVMAMNLMDDVGFLSEQNVKNVNEYFDCVFTYNLRDAEKYGYTYNPNFYEEDSKSSSNNYEWSFVGTNTIHRRAIIDKIYSEKRFQNAYVKIYKGSGTGIKDYIRHDILKNKGCEGSDKYISCKSLSQAELCKIFANSKCIMDISDPKQQGLSFRPFHAMGLHTKLITTNKDIVNYDFYNPNNIYIMDFDEPVLPEENFFQSSYQELSKETFDKYSLKSWCIRFENAIDNRPIW